MAWEILRDGQGHVLALYYEEPIEMNRKQLIKTALVGI